MTLAFIVLLIAGAIGGNVVGGTFARFDFGPLRNTVVGLAGGLVGGQLLVLFVPAFDPLQGYTMNAAMLAATILSGGAGGALATVAVGLVRRVVEDAQAE